MFRKSVWLYAIGLFFISNANADIQTFQANLKNLDQSITANESALSALENGRNQFIKHIQENCRTTNGAKKYEDIRCSDYTKYSDLESSLKAYDASIAQSRKDLQKAKASYKASLDQAKKTLSPSEMLTLIEGSNQLSEQQIRMITNDSKAKIAKLEIEQAKKRNSKFRSIQTDGKKHHRHLEQ